jgi:hypothetical protein
MAAVERGLQEAAAGKVVTFDPHADDALLEELDD